MAQIVTVIALNAARVIDFTSVCLAGRPPAVLLDADGLSSWPDVDTTHRYSWLSLAAACSASLMVTVQLRLACDVQSRP